MRFFLILSPENPVYFVHLQSISVGTSLISRAVNGLKWLVAGGLNGAAMDVLVSCTALHLDICSGERWAGGMGTHRRRSVNHYHAQRERDRSGSPTSHLCRRRVTFHVTRSAQLPRMRLLHTASSLEPDPTLPAIRAAPGTAPGAEWVVTGGSYDHN